MADASHPRVFQGEARRRGRRRPYVLQVERAYVVRKKRVAHAVLVHSFLSFAQFSVLAVLAHSFLSFAQF